MVRFSFIVIALSTFLLGACGPDTILVRPSLDTPAQHVSNGQQLLDRGKVADACREFNRAKELAPDYIFAYIGLAIAFGYKGDLETGMQHLDQAKAMAKSEEEKQAVQQGYERFFEIINTKKE
jgi:Tfp pilus assembly protein PilF